MQGLTPEIHVIAGANGAGKTTFAYAFLKHFLPFEEFLNADEIAKGLSPLNPQASAMQAGRALIERMNLLIADKKSFALETTGSGMGHINALNRMKLLGYKIHLYFLFIESPQLATMRVSNRVKQGGHFVPQDDIHRRYKLGLKRIKSDYFPLADRIEIYDNSANAYLLLAELNGDKIIYDSDKLSVILRKMDSMTI